MRRFIGQGTRFRNPTPHARIAVFYGLVLALHARPCQVLLKGREEGRRGVCIFFRCRASGLLVFPSGSVVGRGRERVERKEEVLDPSPAW